MSEDFFDRISKLSPKRLALVALELHEKVSKLEAQRASDVNAPIAIIGMGCRIPGGASDPESLWSLLDGGRDVIREVPPERWDIDAYFDPDPTAPARMAARTGGFLEHPDRFDASFFGISPEEAIATDPQQRILMEVAWEALENAGIAPESLAGSPTSVFVGVCNADHFLRALSRGPESIDVYLSLGNSHSVAAGRISYFLGLSGPSMSIDTACSSSLVAVHVACQSLRLGESRISLACGVNLMATPETSISLSQAHMLSPDGRCKTFDAKADGFSRGEGCGVLVLKRLADAVADGDRVLAVLRGSAVNQDGRSTGLTVPNGPAQEAVIRAALVNGGVAPADVDYVEAHGTGTPLGDPIEVRALAGAYGPGRAEPLVIGSIKTNLGHLEAAAGVAGVMKVVLALQHERIPPHLHFSEPSPRIAWDEYAVRVEPQGRRWPRGERRRLAGVSSFGFSGTNSHVVIEEAPPGAAAATAEQAPQRAISCLPLSARTAPALATLASRFDGVLAGGEPLADVAHTAGVGRSHFSERVAVVATDTTEARAALGAFAKDEDHASLFRGSAPPGTAPEVVFMFTGAGAQYPGMTQLLYETSPIFRDVIDRSDAILGADGAGRRLKTVLREGSGEDAPIHEMRWTQPALYAVEHAVTQLWRSWGIEPAAVIGHSAGELAAAAAAGVFSFEDGLRLIAERARLMHELPPGGTMAALFAPHDDVTAALEAPAYRGRVAIAALNAADSVVVSGEVAAIDKLLAEFEQKNVKGHRLYIYLAAHSPLVEPALGPLETAARQVTMHAPNVPVAWNLTGGVPLPGGAPDARYWRNHMREPVRFADGISALYADGYRVFLEVGPHPTLAALAQRTLPEDTTTLLASLRRGKDDWRELFSSLASLYVRGAKIDWRGVDQPYPRRRLGLPTYPFQHASWWIPPAAGAPPTTGSGLHYGVTWESSSPPLAAASPARRRWLLLGADHPVAAAFAARLEARGDEVTRAPVDPATLAPEVDEIVYLGALALRGPKTADDPAAAARARTLAGEVPLAWLGRVARGEVKGRVWLVTSGAQSPDGRSDRAGALQAPLWGSGRGFAAEQPAAWGGLVDLAPDGEPEALAATLERAIDDDDGEDQCVWRSGVRWVARLVQRPSPPSKKLELSPDATYLVTGGFGGLGVLVGRWLAERGARHVALLGRRPDATSEGVRAIEAAGAKVIALQGDLTDEPAMAQVFERLRTTAPPVRGIVHAAADLNAAPIGELGPAEITRMLRVKIDGTAILERLARPMPLDFLVLFSSTTALLGAASLTHYAAANAFLDSFASAHDRPERRVIAVNWGAWEKMRFASVDAERQVHEGGLGAMSLAETFDALERRLGAPESQGMVARVDWGVLKPLYEARRTRPLLARLGAAPPAAANTRPTPSGAPEAKTPVLPAKLAEVAPSLRREVLSGFVRAEIADILGRSPPDVIPLDKGLFEMGMDSLMSVALRKRLERAAGMSLPSTLTFNYPNVVALALFLEEKLAPAPPVSTPPVAEASPPAESLDVLSEDELEARLLARLHRHR